jgi:hypothetical protein
MLIKQSLMICSVFTLTWPLATTLQTARQTIGDGLASCMGATLDLEQGNIRISHRNDV